MIIVTFLVATCLASHYGSAAYYLGDTVNVSHYASIPSSMQWR